MWWGPWGGPMWGFGWMFPIIGLVFCLFVIVLIVRALSRGARFTCMGGHDHESDETSVLRREVHELREEVNRLKGAR